MRYIHSLVHRAGFVRVFMLCIPVLFACSKLKTVDTSLHERRNGDMGFGLSYTSFKWRFGNQTRVNMMREEVECLWQATMRSSRPDSISIEIGFRLFDAEGDLLDEISYSAQKISYPDTISAQITMMPGDTARTLRGSFWVARDDALRAVEGDIYIVEMARRPLPGPDSVAVDSPHSVIDSIMNLQEDSGETL